jgi:hypothetical protein
MSATGRPDPETPPAGDIARQLRDSGFVRLVAAANGDAIAAAGQLARALDGMTIPYQTSVSRVPTTAKRDTDADMTVALGRHSAHADVTIGVESRSASRAAYAIADELDAETTQLLPLALAGIIAAGNYPDGEVLSQANSHGIERRPGVAIPTDTVVDGLAHSLLVHAPFSGDTERVTDAFSDLPAGEDSHRMLASLVALAVAEDDDGTVRGATRIERFLRPLAGGPFGTIGGYADVLDATAREQPGVALSVAFGHDDHEAALTAWRQHARRAHEAVQSAKTGRYDGLFVARCDKNVPVGTVARLLQDFRSPEPCVLVVADGQAVAVTPGEGQDIGKQMAETAATVDGVGAGTVTHGCASFDIDPTEFVVAWRNQYE